MAKIIYSYYAFDPQRIIKSEIYELVNRGNLDQICALFETRVRDARELKPLSIWFGVSLFVFVLAELTKGSQLSEAATIIWGLIVFAGILGTIFGGISLLVTLISLSVTSERYNDKVRQLLTQMILHKESGGDFSSFFYNPE